MGSELITYQSYIHIAQTKFKFCVYMIFRLMQVCLIKFANHASSPTYSSPLLTLRLRKGETFPAGLGWLGQVRVG